MKKKTGHSEKAKVAKAAGIVAAATLVSRVFGLVRDTVIAALFGANWMTDAFWVAFRIPNMLRRFMGEGSLTASFVPVFTDYLHKKTKADALELAQNTFTILSILLAAVTVLGILLSPVIVGLIAPGFIREPGQFTLAVFLNRLMFPYIFFICLVALGMGILNSFRHFTTPALSPVMLNIAMIASAFALRSFFEAPITALAVGVLIGGVLQLAVQWPFLRRYGVRFQFRFNLHHPGLRQIGLLMLPALLGAGVATINVFIGTVLASLLPGGSVTYLFYADRVMELPMGIFAIAIGTAALPSFSTHVAEGNITELKSSLSFSLRLMLFLTIPSMAALMALHLPIVTVLYQRGAFSPQDALYTGQALLCYAAGLCAFSVHRVFIASFYSLKDTKWPMKTAVISLLVNVMMSLILMHPLKHNGLALATSIAGVVNVLVLAFVLKSKIGGFLDRAFYVSVGKIILSTVVMLGAVCLADSVLPWETQLNFQTRLIYLSFAIFAGALAFFVAAYLLKSPEMHALVDTLKKRLGRA